MKKIFAIWIILILSSMSITAVASDDWLTFQHDNRRTGFTDGVGNIQTPKVDTMFSSNSDLSFPVVYNDVVFIATRDGSVYAIEGNNNEKWSRTQFASADSLAVADGVLYVGSNDGAVYAYSTTSGNEQWSRTTSSVESLALADIDCDGEIEVVIGGNDGVFALNKNNGDFEWSFTNVKSVSSIVIVNQIVYAGSTNGAVYAINGNIVNNIWSRTTSSVKALAVADIDSDGENDVVVSTSNGVSVFNSNNGHTQWELTIKSGAGHLALADVDNDGKIEIVTNAETDLSVIDNNDAGNNPPSIPEGSYNKNKNEIMVSSVDPDGDQIRYGVSWDNDEEIDEWTDYKDSGATAKIDCGNHRDTASVVAQDVYGARSSTVSVTAKNKIKTYPLLEEILKFFPNAFPILRMLLNL